LVKLSEILKINNKSASAGVAERIVLYLKNEIAQVKSNVNGRFVAIPQLSTVPVEELFSGLTDSSFVNIGNNLSSRDFHAFMMQFMFTFEIVDEQAKSYCKLFNINYPELNIELLKNAVSGYNDSHSNRNGADQAYAYLKKFYMKSRNVLDQRIKRFWKDVAEYYADDPVFKLRKETNAC